MKTILLIFCIALAGCESKQKCELPLQAMSETMDKALIDELRKLDVDFFVKKDGQLCITYSSANQVSVIMHNIYVKEIPEDYSEALSESIKPVVVEALQNLGIPFQEKSFLGTSYLIWSPQYDYAVRTVIQQKNEQRN